MCYLLGHAIGVKLPLIGKKTCNAALGAMRRVWAAMSRLDRGDQDRRFYREEWPGNRSFRVLAAQVGVRGKAARYSGTLKLI